jgi:recombination protein RecA
VLRFAQVLKDNEGITVRTKVVKNKVAPPFRVVEFDILFGSGIDGYGCLLDASEACGAIERKGSWYSAGTKQIAQGRRAAIEYLRGNAAMTAEMDGKVRKYLEEKKGKTDPSVLDGFMEQEADDSTETQDTLMAPEDLL